MFQTFDVTARPQDAPPRIARLRDWMAAEGLDGFLIPRADAHQGEYVAPCDARLAWATGFTGSAGIAAILRDRAALFVDGRYTVQAKAQTDPATFEQVRWPETTVAAWLPSALPEGGTVGFDPWLHTVREVEALRKVEGVELRATANGVDAIWTDRPERPSAPMTVYPEALAGRGHAEKRAQIAATLREEGLAAFVTNQPDALAWLLNVRGGDLERLPVGQAFGVIHADASIDLICAPEKAASVRDHLGPDVRIVAPDGMADLLAGLEGTVGFDAGTCPVAMAEALRDGRPVDDPVALPKARKSEAEIAATIEAHLRDGAAMVRFLRWLDEERPDDLTEIGAATALEGFRRETNQLRDISFETIAGAGPNAALPHYRVNTETDRPLAGEPVLLVDSGGQYLDGTTDITRTVPLGDPPAEVAHHFTRVLQGMVAVSRARFPKGVAGCHLDALARLPLWAEHKDFDHGTGHGVGVYLGVHEGPQRISRASSVPLEPGMILSNEPGYYREGAFGIRIENLIVVREMDRPEGGDDRTMLGFETLTWVPIDRRLIAARLLSPDERAWIDRYHAQVAERIGPRVEGADRAWLLRMCAPL
jgi:Xaa-Pro aminopeptidase